MRKNVRNLLGSFLFKDDDVDKKVKVLSGGEKSRLAMCKLLLQPYNLLVLDEPTNHLDMRSKDILKQALLNYDGTLIVVSHDRDFLEGLTNKVYEFRNGSIKEHIGDLKEYLAARKISSLNELQIKKKAVVAETPKAIDSNKQDEQKKQKDLKNIQQKISKSEKEIDLLEKQIKDIDDSLMNPESYQKAMNDKTIFANYEELKKKLEAEMKNWEVLQIDLERV